MRKKHIGILLLILCTFLTAAGQLFLKRGMSTFDISMLLTNYSLMLGLIFYGLGAGLLIFALRFGELSALYPLISLTFIWVTISSAFFLKEAITAQQLGGISLVLLGVVMLTR